MPSPFPGIDPFIEISEWEDFHARLNTVIADLLTPRIRPKYTARVQRRVYVEHMYDEEQVRWADVAVIQTGADSATATLPAAGVASAIAPVECVLPMPQERRETFVVIREIESMEIVTVIETLSPSNKRAGGDGRKQYLEKREELLQSTSHLVELDLLRGGIRLPTVAPLPHGDYYGIVSRRGRRPKDQVYAWTLRDAPPPIPIPLKKGDPDATLDLATAVSTVYDRASYDLTLDYRQSLEPLVSETDAAWVAELIRSREGTAS
jgi:hypothetical protein